MNTRTTAKLLYVEWNEKESCTYYVDYNKHSRAHDHETWVSLDNTCGTYKFDKATGEVTLDTDVGIRQISVLSWFLLDD